MKILLINGSPHVNGSTKEALKIVGDQLATHSVQVEYIQIGGINIRGCQGCQTCFKKRNKQCILQDELTPIMNQCYDDDTRGIIIGSPTYCSNVTTETKAFIDRVSYVSKANSGLLKDKVGAAVVIDRRAGANFVYSAINFFFGISEMPIATSSYWNSGRALRPGDLAHDKEGIQTLQNLADNFAKLLKISDHN